MKFSELNGMSVVGVQGADTLGKVDDIYFDLGQRTALALRVRLPGLLPHQRALMWQDMKAIGRNAITVASSEVLQEQADVPALANATHFGQLTGMKVMTQTGNDVGTLADVDLDGETGKIDAFLLREGFLDRIQGHEHLIPVSAVTSIGNDMIVVDSQAIAKLP